MSDIDSFLSDSADQSTSIDSFLGSSAPKPSTAKRVASDIGTSLKRGVQALPGVVTGVADLGPAAAFGVRPFNTAADVVGDITGFKPGQWAKQAQLSPENEKAARDVGGAWAGAGGGETFGDQATRFLEAAPDIAKAYARNPAYVANQVAESLPASLAGGVVSRPLVTAGRAVIPAAEGAAARMAPGYLERKVGTDAASEIAGGVGEGVVQAGSALDQSEGPDQQRNALAALGSGVGDAVIAAGAGRVAHKLGLETSQTALAKGFDQATGALPPVSALHRILGGAINEAVLQELPQSIQEKIWENYAEGKPLLDGAIRQGIEGAIAGGLMGGAFNIRGGGRAAEAAPDIAAPGAATQPPASPIAPAGPLTDVAQVVDAAAVPPVPGIPTPAGDPIRAAKLPEGGPLSRGVNTLLEGEAQAADVGQPVPAPVAGAMAGVPSVDALPGQQQSTQAGGAEQSDDRAAQGTGGGDAAATRPNRQQSPAPSVPVFDPTTGQISQPQRGTFPTLDAVQAFISQARLNGSARIGKVTPVQLADGQFSYVREGEPGYEQALATSKKKPTLADRRAKAQQEKADGQPQLPGVATPAAVAAGSADGAGDLGGRSGGDLGRVAPDATGGVSTGAVAPAPGVREAAPVGAGSDGAPAVAAPNTLSDRRAQAQGKPQPTALGATIEGRPSGTRGTGAADVMPKSSEPVSPQAQAGSPAEGAEGSRLTLAAPRAPDEREAFVEALTDDQLRTMVKKLGQPIYGKSVPPKTARYLHTNSALGFSIDDLRGATGRTKANDPKQASADRAETQAPEDQASAPARSDAAAPAGVPAAGPAAVEAAGVTRSEPVESVDTSQGRVQEPAKNEQVKPPKNRPPAVAKAAANRAAKLADYFAPGNVVQGYGGQHDQVVEFTPVDDNGRWSVKVRQVIKKDEQWIDDPKDTRERQHSTEPSEKELKAGPAVRASAKESDPETPVSETDQEKLDPAAPDEEATPAIETAPVASATSEKPSAKAGEPAKIDDFGERLAGARKDYAATLKDAMDVDVAAEPLSKSWPEPDYQKLLDAGADPFVVAWIHAARDEVPTKPQKSWKLKGWVDGLKSLRETSRSLLNGEVAPDRAKELAEKVGPAMRIVLGRAELYQLVGHDKSLKGITLQHHHYTLYRGEQNVSKWAIEQKAKATAFSNWPREISIADTKQEVLDEFKAKIGSIDLGKKAKGQASQFVIYRKRGTDGATIGKKIGREYVDLYQAADVKAAREYLADNTDALEAKLAKYRETPLERKDTNQPRVGDDHRNGAPVTPEVFADTFGFRGVQFGNYVEQGRRQSDLNEAFDGLMDMAAVLGVPPRALSLNGQLGLAFGARGRGGKNAPAAHFEPGNVVINLTKGGGPGSLAHEWWHGLDNYFSRESGDNAGFVTGGSKTTAMRDELRTVFKTVQAATQALTLRRRAAELDKRRSKPYWNTPEELSARAFESYVIAKLNDQNAANDYLANVVDEKVWNIDEAARAELFGGEKVETYPYPGQAELPAVRTAFDEFFKTIETRLDDAGNVAMFSLADEIPASRQPSRSEQNALRALAQNDDLFALPRSSATTVEKIAADIDPEIKVTKRNVPGEQRYDLTFPDGNVVHMTVRKPNPYGPTLYGFDQVDGELKNKLTERPGENPEDVDPDTEDVFIDASKLTPGGAGTKAYQIAATYAHNTGRIFIGDPAGLSDEALRRRSEQMLSSALKFGTTAHLAPHPRQVEGGAKLGVPPLKWVYGDDIGNIRRLVDLNLAALENRFPDIKKVDFNAATGQFVDAQSGKPISRLALGRRVNQLRSRGAGPVAEAEAGRRTVARGVVLRSLLREEGRAGEAGGRRDGLLDRLARVGSNAGAATKGIFYDRADVADSEPSLRLADTPAKVDTGAYAQATPAQQALADKFRERVARSFPGTVFHAVAASGGTQAGRAATGADERVGAGNPAPDRSLQAVQTVAKRLFGHEVVFVKFDGPTLFNGAMSDAIPGVVFINVESKRPHMAVLGHELLHQLRSANPTTYNVLKMRLERLLRNPTAHYAALQAKYDQAGKSSAAVKFEEELHADIVGDFFMDPQFWQDLARDRPGLFKRVVSAVLKFLDDALAQMTGSHPFGTDKIVADVRAARAAVVDAFGQFSAAQVGASDSASEGVNLSIADDLGDAAKAAFNNLADRFHKGEVIVGRTSRDYTPEQAQAFKNVGFQTEAPKLQDRIQALWKDAGKKMAQGIVDQFAPVKDISKEAYGLLRLAKGASGAFQVLMQGGQLKLDAGVYNFDESKRGGVVDKLMIPLQGEHHDFLRWIAANRAERLKGQGKENLFSDADIAALKSLSNGVSNFDYTIQHGARKGQATRDRTLIYADALKTFNEFQTNVLDLAEQSGLIDGEARKLWEHEFYVPFYRVEEDGSVSGADIKNGAVRQQAFKSLTGRTEKLNADLLDNTLMNWAHLLDASAKNRAAKASIEAAEKMGAAAQVDGPVGKGTVWYRESGERRYSFVNDPHLLTAITALEYTGMRSPVLNAMSFFKNVLTTGVTASPFFKVRNLIRDSIQVIGTSSIDPNGFKNIAAGWKLTDPKSDAYFRLLAGGGMIHFGSMLEGSEAKRVQKLVAAGVDDSTILDSDRKVKAFYDKFIAPGIHAYNELGERGEAVNRAALYDQLIKQGLSHADASLQARDLMDFSMQGSFGTIRFLTQVVPFFNARLQGLYKLGRAAKEDPARFSAVVGAAALLSIGLLAAGSDDDDWKKREDWDRNGYWWFKFGGVAFRIPKPFEIGSIATLAERSFEFVFDKEMTGSRFRSQVMALLGDNLSMNPVPQLIKPLIDVYSNRDSFTGRPIESLGMERLQSEYRFNGRTSMTARALSTTANSVSGLVGAESLSPVQIDHLLRGYFGWLGTFVVGAGDLIAREATDQPDQPTPDYWKTITGGLVSDLRDAPSRYVSQMYTQAKAIEEAYATAQMLRKEGKLQEAAEFTEANKAALAQYKSIERIKRTEGKLNAAVRAIENSDRSADDKRERIRALNDQKDRVARSIVPAS